MTVTVDEALSLAGRTFWSVSGLNRIKTWAWKIAESKGTWTP